MTNTRQRPNWDDYFLTIATSVATRADCRRRQVGAVLVTPNHRILSTGYNGAPAGHPGCLDGHCPRGLLTYEQVAEFTDYTSGPGRCIAVHAEANALLYSTSHTDRQGATMYITARPCPQCRILLMGAGITRAVWPDGEETF